MTATVNGEIRCDTTSAEMIWTVEELVAWASAAEALPAGSLLATGTANRGSGVEIGQLLQPGDVVELSVTGLGTLRDTVGHKAAGWIPAPRRRHTAAQPVPSPAYPRHSRHREAGGGPTPSPLHGSAHSKDWGSEMNRKRMTWVRVAALGVALSVVASACDGGSAGSG
jgi:hypothetical protein